MLFEAIASGAIIMGGTVWAVRVCQKTGWRLLHPWKYWDAKLDVVLSLATACATFFVGPVQGAMFAGMSITGSLLLRLYKNPDSAQQLGWR